MRILVTGAGGYVGKNVCQALSKTDHEVIALDKVPFNVPSDTVMVSDIRDLYRIPYVDAVIHLAADISVPESVNLPNQYFNNNVNETYHLITMARRAGVEHFVFASSAATYGNVSGLLKEDMAGSPINPYGWTKWIGEQMLRLQSDMTYSALRFFNIAGWDKETDTGERRVNPYHLVTMAAKAATGERSDLKIFGHDYSTPDGTCVRDYVHVVDVADAVVKSAEYGRNDQRRSFTANVSYGQGFSVAEVANVMRSIKDFKVDVTDRRPGDPDMLVGDNTNISNINIGWTPKYKNDIYTICESAYLWEMELKKHAK